MEKFIYNYSPYSDSDFLEKCKIHLASNELLPLDFLKKFGKTDSIKWYKMLVAVFDGKVTGKVHWKYKRRELMVIDSIFEDRGRNVYQEHLYEVDEDREIDTQTILPLDIEDFEDYTFVSNAPIEVAGAIRHLHNRIYIYKNLLEECDKFPIDIYKRINPDLLDISAYSSLMKKTINDEIKERNKKANYEIEQMKKNSSIHPFEREYKISDTIYHNWHKWYYSNGTCVEDAIKYSLEEPFMCYIYVPYMEWSYKDKSGWIFMNPCNEEIHTSELPLLDEVPIVGAISVVMNIAVLMTAVSCIALLFFLVAWIFTPIKFLSSMLYMAISAVAVVFCMGINKLLDKYNAHKNKQARLEQANDNL